MTTAEQFRAAVASPAGSISVAGVPWPTYKVVSLLAGLFVFLVVGAATLSAGSAVLSGAGVAILAWWGLRILHAVRR
ncbi:hypothetical protein ACNUDN_13200 [Mycobacterium sp. smrl_JER01]|uniref:hypothetical protein n=1 Tax=Mycobacterium sp. smrl_JER01 TaxID=3402633 RepID=UPI003AD62013